MVITKVVTLSKCPKSQQDLVAVPITVQPSVCNQIASICIIRVFAPCRLSKYTSLHMFPSVMRSMIQTSTGLALSMLAAWYSRYGDCCHWASCEVLVSCIDPRPCWNAFESCALSQAFFSGQLDSVCSLDVVRCVISAHKWRHAVSAPL